MDSEPHPLHPDLKRRPPGEPLRSTELPLGREVDVSPPHAPVAVRRGLHGPSGHPVQPTPRHTHVEAQRPIPGRTGHPGKPIPRRPLSEREQSLALDAQQLRHLSTPDLLKRLMDESRLLVRAEVLVARQELRDEVASAKTAGILGGAGLGLGLSGVALLFVALAAALPLPLWLAALLVGLAVLLVAGLLAWAAAKKAPTQPMARSQERLRRDFALTRESLQ